MLHQPVVAQNYRETRDFACESKFLLDADQAELIRRWARTYLNGDPHAKGDFGDQYQVSSIYFDTPQLDVFKRNGSFGRSKYRIRRYSAGNTVFLERKTKTDTQVSKRRTLIHIQELERLRSVSEMSSGWLGYWFQRRLQLRGLQSVCQINYQRVARIGTSENGPCRLTLDNELLVQSATTASFSDTGGASLLPAGRYILELKYRYALPVLFRRLLHEFAPVPQRISKYRLAISTLDMTQRYAATCEVI